MDKGIFIIGQEPNPNLTIEKANQLFTEIKTEKDIADLFALLIILDARDKIKQIATTEADINIPIDEKSLNFSYLKSSI